MMADALLIAYLVSTYIVIAVWFGQYLEDKGDVNGRLALVLGFLWPMTGAILVTLPLVVLSWFFTIRLLVGARTEHLTSEDGKGLTYEFTGIVVKRPNLGRGRPANLFFGLVRDEQSASRASEGADKSHE